MEGKLHFPWIKDIIHHFSRCLLTDYDSDTLSILHRNIDKEIKLIYSNNIQAVERAKILYEEIIHLYEHMRLKIIQHPDFHNATLSCVKMISQLIKVGLVLTQGLVSCEWMERILTAINLFPGEKVLVYDSLLLVNGLKKVHHKPYSAILKYLMTSSDHDEFITDPLVYLEIILLFRRLKALVINKHKEKYTVFVTKIKPPANLISWLASLDDDYSPYLKKLKYKKIALQLMKKILPESFIKKIRYMALNQYNFEADNSEFKIEEHSADLFIIDNTSSLRCDNMDLFVNSHKIVGKKKENFQMKRKRKDLSNNEDKINIDIKESSKNIKNKKYASKSNKCSSLSKTKQKPSLLNSNSHTIVSKKKKKFTLAKNTESETSIILNKDISDSDLFFQDIEDSSSHHLIKSFNEEYPESVCENKINNMYVSRSDGNISSYKDVPNVKEQISSSKKKKKSKSKTNPVENTKLKTSDIPNEDFVHSDLFFYDVQDSSTSKQLNLLNSKAHDSFNEKEITNIYIEKSDTEMTDQNPLPNSNKHVKKKKKSKCKSNIIKNIESKISTTLNEDISDNALFIHDVEGNDSFKKLKTSYNDSNSKISPKRILSDDADNNTVIQSILSDKNRKKMRSSKDNKTAVSNTSVSIDDSGIISHQDLICETKDGKSKNSFENDILFFTEISGKKRKKIVSNDDSATSDDKCIYFKKLMLKKVSNEMRSSSQKSLNEKGDINSVETVENISVLSDTNEKSKNVSVNTTEDTLHKNSFKFVSNHQGLMYKNNKSKDPYESGEDVIFIDEISEEKKVLSSVTDKNFMEEESFMHDIPTTCDTDKFNDSIHLKNNNVDFVEDHSSMYNSSKDSVEACLGNRSKDCDQIKHAQSQTDVSISDEKNESIISIVITTKNVESQTNITISDENNESSISTENILPSSESSCLNNTSNLFSDIKISEKYNEDTFQIFIESENNSKISENSETRNIISSQNNNLTDNKSDEQNLSKENILSSNEQTCLDSLTSSVNNVETSVKEEQNNLELMLESEKTISVSENSEKLKNIPLDDIVTGTERNLPNELACSKNITNLVNNVEIFVKEKQVNLQASLESEKVNISCENSDKLNEIYSKDVINRKRNESNLSNETISSSDVSSSNIISTSVSDLETSLEEKQTGLQVLFESEKVVNKSNSSDKLKSIKTPDSSAIDNDRSPLNELTYSEKINNTCENSNKLNDIQSKDDNETDRKNNESCLSSEAISSSNMPTLDSMSNSESDFETPVEKKQADLQTLLESEKVINICTSSDKLKSTKYSDNSVKDDETSVLNKLTSLEKINNAETSIKENEANLQLLESEKVTNICEKDDNLKVVISQDDNVITKESNEISLSKKNILPSNESTCLDNINSSASGIEIVIKKKRVLLESEKVVNISENSDKLKDVISQDDNLVNNENNKVSLPYMNILTTEDESICSGTFNKSINDVKILEKKNSLQLSLESKNVEKALLNSEKFSVMKNAAELNSLTLHSPKSNFPELQKFPDEINYNEKEVDNNLEFQEQFFVLDEINSDIEDCKSTFENSSPVKAAASSNNSEYDNHQITSLLREDTSKTSDKYCTSEMDNNISLKQIDISNESKFKRDNHQIKLILKENNAEVSCENSMNEIINIKLPDKASTTKKLEDIPSNKNCYKHLSETNNQVKSIKEYSEASIEKSDNEVCCEKTSDSNLLNIKKDLLIVDEIKHSSEKGDSKKEIFSTASETENTCSSSLLGTKISKGQEINSATFIPSFSDNKSYESFSEISFKNKDKSIDVKSISSVPINNFSSAASTELFSTYRNEQMHDEDKTESASLCSKDSAFPNWQEIDEIKSQSAISDHSFDDIDSNYSQEEEEEGNKIDAEIPSEDRNAYLKNIDESLPFENSAISSTSSENFIKDTNLNNSSVNDNINEQHENSVLPIQSLKEESKCQTNSGENFESDVPEAQELGKKELKHALIDHKSSSSSENNSNHLCSSEKACDNSLTLNNKGDISSSQTSNVKNNVSKAKSRSKKSSIDYNNTSDKRYSLRHRKTNLSKDDSANLEIDLNKLKFDPPNNKSTRSRRESKFVKLLTSDANVQENAKAVSTKRETRSSATKSDEGIESNAPSYNLRNRKSIIAPPKLKI